MPEYFEASFNDIGLDYLDLYLMHTPFAFEHVPGDLHPKNADGSIKVDNSTDLIAVWKVRGYVLKLVRCSILHSTYRRFFIITFITKAC